MALKYSTTHSQHPESTFSTTCDFAWLFSQNTSEYNYKFASSLGVLILTKTSDSKKLSDRKVRILGLTMENPGNLCDLEYVLKKLSFL